MTDIKIHFCNKTITRVILLGLVQKLLKPNFFFFQSLSLLARLPSFHSLTVETTAVIFKMMFFI